VQRFFAYMSLFTFAMLMLVTANNLLQLFFGWEGVGLVSYLLIGYWYEKPSANAAAIKAFIVNRVGDLGFAVGIALTYYVFGTISFDGIFAAAASHAGDGYRLFGTNFPVLEIVAVLLLVGADLSAHMAGRCDGRPDTDFRPHPCGDNGCGWCVHDCAHVAGDQPGAGGDGVHHHYRREHGIVRGYRGLRAK
jgi:hypothetical protein